jgi:transposase InsO family protein
VNASPRTVFAQLFDAGRYLCSVSSFYRILRADGETQGRRNQRTHPVYTKPELLATGACQLWSWDITKLKGPGKWEHFHLYVILDVFSRYVVGWMLEAPESSDLAKALIATCCEREDIGYMTPQAMHSGRAPQIFVARQGVLDRAFELHPERFKGCRPQPPALPTQAGTNWPNPLPAATGTTPNYTLN